MKWTDKKGIQHLVALCATKGITKVIISPGSRSAPLTISFNRYPGVETWVVPDERVAAFTALGMAQQLGTPIALVCTSGSALLNYAPAVAEAYYSHIPLLILSADRPSYWIDQREGQSINQIGVYDNYVKGSFNLPIESGNPMDLQHQDRLINEAINLSQSGNPGPVHINVPMEEPLYQLVDMENVDPKVIDEVASDSVISEAGWRIINEELANFEKVMILVGQRAPDAAADPLIKSLADNKKVVVLSECTSNILGENIVGCIDRNILTITDESWDDYLPDLLITMGGAVVSKKIKQALRKKNIHAHWHVSEYDKAIDTYGHLSKNIRTTTVNFLEQVQFADKEYEFAARWQDHNATIRKIHHQVLEDIPFSDLRVFKIILDAIPHDSQVQLANSSAVRYAQLFDQRTDIEYFANRGVSGIDGSTSTAIGAAMVSDKIVTLITGDMSFFYDSNAFWHSQIPDNFKCIIINNGGGGIFRIIAGPDEVNELEEFFEVNQYNQVKKIAEAYNIEYLYAHDEPSLKNSITALYEEKNTACILEITTPREINSVILKEYFTKMDGLRNG